MALRNAGSLALDRIIAHRRDPVIRRLHFVSSVQISFPAIEAVTLMGYVEQPFTLRRFHSFAQVSLINFSLTDILISEDNRVDNAAVLRDQRLSGNYSANGGFASHNNSRPHAISLYVASGKRWIKSRTLITSGTSSRTQTYIWIELY